MIQTKGLHIGYKNALLKVNDFTLDQGQLYFLVGKNGAGKSTFLKTLSGQIQAISGTVFLNHKNSASIPFSEMPKTISFVSSHFPIVDFLKVEEFIALGRSPYSSYFGKIKNNDNQIIKDILLKLNITHLKDRFTSDLSDGEKQLVAIAKSLVQETPIILLDEPTAFLDYSNKTLVLKTLVNICKELNKCIVLSSHDIDLSLEMNCSFLAVHSLEKELQLLPSSISKEGLVKICF